MYLPEMSKYFFISLVIVLKSTIYKVKEIPNSFVNATIAQKSLAVAFPT